MAAVACALLWAVVPHARSQPPSAAAVGAESRLALVIGNSSYKDAPLVNPVNDANAMARALEGLGFKVTLHTNASRSQMRQAIRRFGDELQASRGVGLFYFAGHGVQINARNYLIPVGTDIQRDYEVEDEAIDANSILSMMQAARARVNIVILDACRNNPFARGFRASSAGLAPMQAPAGTLLAYSTAPGEVASDGSGDNGLYTRHLLHHMVTPRVKIEDVFKNVRIAVQQETGGKQIPWENTSLTGEFYFNPTASAVAQPASGGISREEVESAVLAALRRRDEDAAARARLQQEEIERAVQAALSKREQEAAAAQAGNQTQDAQAARVAIERLTQELAELRAARQKEAATPSPSAQPSPTAQTAVPTQSVAAPATTKPQLALAAPASRPPAQYTVGKAVDRPDVRVGDHWKYQVTDLFTGLKRTVAVEVQSVTENRIYTRSAPVQVAGMASAGTVEVYDRDWNLTREGTIEYTPHYPAMQFPLESGRRWQTEVKYDDGTTPMTEQLSAQVIGWEKVVVPAGTFNAIKIELRGHFRQGGPTSGRNDTGTILNTVWYAPSIRNFVKREAQKRSFNSGSNRHHDERWELIELPK